MGTRDHPEASGLPYFVTFATAERRPIFGSRCAAQLFVDQLLKLRGELGFLVLAYVVMPDHVHLVIVPSETARLPRAMQYVKGRFARLYNAANGVSGKIWQSRYYETVIRDQDSLLRRIRYVEENPLRARLAEHTAGFAFSSAATPTGDLEKYL